MSFNFIPYLKAINKIFRLDDDLETHWEEVLEISTSFGFIVDYKECVAHYASANDSDSLFCIVANGLEHLPPLVLNRLESGWIAGAGNHCFWSFINKGKSLYCIEPPDGKLVKI